MDGGWAPVGSLAGQWSVLVRQADRETRGEQSTDDRGQALGPTLRLTFAEI